MESMRRKRCRHNPLVVWLVQTLVYGRVVQATVNPVDAEIRERDEQRELNEAVELEWLLRERIV